MTRQTDEKRPTDGKRQAIYGLVLTAFTAYTLAVMATAEQSLLAFGWEMMSRPDTAQLVIDLYIACALLAVWMYDDHRQHGGSLRSLVPFYAVTLIFASMGPLLYLVLRRRLHRRCAVKTSH